ncbi:DNA polymerase [Streptomyces sp. NPDC091027]|uniref:DNA polymerase n=1 Tax=Streptomyces sp. NPDC091027 TaxID=3365971 RepID=UPI0037FCE9E3
MRDVILTLDDLEEAVAHFMRYDEFVIDIETVGEHRDTPIANEILWVALATYGRAVVIPMGHPNGDHLISKATWRKNKTTGERETIPAVWSDPPKQLRPSQVWKALEPLIFSSRRKIAHSATFDLGSLAKYYGGRIPPKPFGCTLVAAWLLDENRLNGLKALVEARYRHKYDTENVGKCVEKHAFSTVARYAYLDAKYAWLLWRVMCGDLIEQGLSRIMALELGVTEVLLDMHETGIYVDEGRLFELEHELVIMAEEIKTRLFRAAGKVFNVNSPQQRQDVLFAPKSQGGQALKPLKLTDGGVKKKRAGEKTTYRDYSTDAETLKEYPENEVCRILLEYAEVDKLLSTYVYGYLGKGDQPRRIFNGRIHPKFKQTGARTGRFSGSAPNLQNVPRPGTELGTKVRSLFVAPAGHKLLVADWGQIELRVLAHYLGEGALYEGFLAGVDAHTATAALIFGVSWDEVTKPMRQVAKGVNFAIVYSAGPETVAAMAGVSVAEAERIMVVHQQQFPEIYRFKESVIRTVRKRTTHDLTTLLGRKRRLPEIVSSKNWLRAKGERRAVNSLIQGSSADLIKLAMVRLHRSIKDSGLPIKLSLTVHDELVVICPEDLVDVGSRMLQEAMIGDGIQGLVNVPLTADVVVCDRWSEAKD